MHWIWLQVTIGPAANRCVTYSALYSNQSTTDPSVEGFLKCPKPSWTTSQGRIEHHFEVGDGSDPAETCAPHLSNPPGTTGCNLYRNVVIMGSPRQAPSVTQWLLHGRRNNIEHNWIPSARTPTPAHRLSNGTVTTTVTVHTSFPFDDNVSFTVAWEDQNVKKIMLTPRIRIPSWIPATNLVAVAVNGRHVASGKPGTYLSLPRIWSNGDAVSFELPMVAALIQYPLTGIDNIKGYEGKRCESMTRNPFLPMTLIETSLLTLVCVSCVRRAQDRTYCIALCWYTRQKPGDRPGD